MGVHVECIFAIFGFDVWYVWAYWTGYSKLWSSMVWFPPPSWEYMSIVLNSITDLSLNYIYQHRFHIVSVTSNHNIESMRTKWRVVFWSFMVLGFIVAGRKRLKYELNQCWKKHKLNIDELALKRCQCCCSGAKLVDKCSQLFATWAMTMHPHFLSMPTSINVRERLKMCVTHLHSDSTKMATRWMNFTALVHSAYETECGCIRD